MSSNIGKIVGLFLIGCEQFGNFRTRLIYCMSYSDLLKCSVRIKLERKYPAIDLYRHGLGAVYMSRADSILSQFTVT